MTANPQTCQKCGSPVTPGMKFCESCGAKIEPVLACSQCGAPLVPEVKFCESCGAPVTPPAPPAPETPPAPEAKIPAELPVKAEEKTVSAPEKPAPAPALVKEPPKTEKVKEVPKETGPKKPVSQKTLIIAGVIVLAILGAAVYFVGLPMLSGSGIPSQNQQVAPGTTASGTSGTPATSAGTVQAPAFSLTAGPTQVPPANHALIVDVERDSISSLVTVTFQGGSGQYGVRELVATLTKSDGTVETKSFKPDNRGIFITLQGTPKTDRIEVTANFYNGESYKIVDHVFEYKKRVGSSD